MPGPSIKELYQYLTLPRAALRLGLHPAKLRRRLKDGLLPEPTYTNKYGLRFFDEEWVAKALLILENSYEGNKH